MDDEEVEARENGDRDGVVLGLDGGATSTVCVCIPAIQLWDRQGLPDPLPVLSRAIAGCSNYNSVGGIGFIYSVFVLKN